MRIPGATRMSRRELAILNELVQLRDRIARERDLPVRYVLPDDVVAGLATLSQERARGFRAATPDGCRHEAAARPGDSRGGGARPGPRTKTNYPSAPTRARRAARDAIVSLLGAAVAEISRERNCRRACSCRGRPRSRRARGPARSCELRARLALQPWRTGARCRSALAAAFAANRAENRRLRLGRSESTILPMNPNPDSFKALDTLRAGPLVSLFPPRCARKAGMTRLERLPFSLKILMENLLRCEDGRTVKRDDIEALARLESAARQRTRDRLHPGSRVAAGFHRRSLRRGSGRDARRDGRRWAVILRAINPLQPVEMVIDHSVQVDYFGTNDALAKNTANSSSSAIASGMRS